jgi:hypothetical protein
MTVSALPFRNCLLALRRGHWSRILPGARRKLVSGCMSLWLLFLYGSAVEASLTPRTDTFSRGLLPVKERARLSLVMNSERPSAGGVPFILTETTEVLLDGRPCKYRDVPPQAEITRLEVGPDRRTVLRIFFRTR